MLKVFTYGENKAIQMFCICLYGTALWHRCSKSSLLKFKLCYNKCLKLFFGYRKFSSVIEVLMDVGLPCFDTVIRSTNTHLTVVSMFVLMLSLYI